MPQILENVTVKNKDVIKKNKCKVAIKKQIELWKKRKNISKKSGTEPKIRIMASLIINL